MACAPELCRGLLDGHSLQEAALSPPDIPVRGSIGPEQPTRKLMCQEPQPSEPTQLPQEAQPAHEAAASEEQPTAAVLDRRLRLKQLLAAESEHFLGEYRQMAEEEEEAVMSCTNNFRTYKQNKTASCKPNDAIPAFWHDACYDADVRRHAIWHMQTDSLLNHHAS
ncbi:hypothetical protein D9Q98_006738 [Chlorella vulgaris]|uniref:Uncharacterized protein n=1 Tax=Chlorella vulgaris TaxID=3077 RepID=A0A9D4TKS4_CHLVU|nr:hypothetical protein D9Q98_006738 [Chlorella vulgaris]